MTRPAKYAELVIDWLCELGYTHCFFVAGGNIMHLLDGARTRLTCVPVVHEVAAGIAVEYFNESGGEGRAFALVTAGPGLTNIVSAMSGAWLESRELLVIGGQVKSTDLASDGVRQRGIQEIDGVALAAPVAVESRRITEPVGRKEFESWVQAGYALRPGPVFIELCLDAQGAPVTDDQIAEPGTDGVAGRSEAPAPRRDEIDTVISMMRDAQRPIWLIGGGVSRQTAASLSDRWDHIGAALMTTWNGADRVPAESSNFFGRPNTWGQRAANLLMSQADLIVAFGSRLGLQQTGFNWQEWAPNARVVQIDIDEAELTKGHPRIDVGVRGDANVMLRELAAQDFESPTEWLAYCREVRALLPLDDPQNETGEGYISPYRFYLDLGAWSTSDDILVPCSSGGANSVALQTLEPRAGQLMVTDKGLASMGYGLAGAIGAALGHRSRRVLLVEGDGGFMQNVQELATVAVQDLNIKVFIFANEGYGSIRMTQKNYFGGAYLGCDTKTGLGFPDWHLLFQAFGIPVRDLSTDWRTDANVLAELDRPGPAAFIVPIDPLQTYYPKITSRITASGSMESNPLHEMSPELAPELHATVTRYL